MNRYLSLIGVLALAGCVSTVSLREHVADAPQIFRVDPAVAT